MQEAHNDGLQEGLTQGRSQMATDLALDMPWDKKPIDEIVKYSRLSPEQVQELAQQL